MKPNKLKNLIKRLEKENKAVSTDRLILKTAYDGYQGRFDQKYLTRIYMNKGTFKVLKPFLNIKESFRGDCDTMKLSKDGYLIYIRNSVKKLYCYFQIEKGGAFWKHLNTLEKQEKSL